MLKVIVLVGGQASGKSTWAKKEVATDPLNYLRISNDDLRASFNRSVFSSDYEKLIRETRLFLLKEGLKRNKNIIVDNTNISKRCWEDCVKVCQSANVDVMLLEKLFYEDLEELLERNSKREGVARVPDEVVKKFWKDLGGKSFASRKPRTEIFKKRDVPYDRFVEPMKFDENLPRAIIADLDGTLAIINGNKANGKTRSPYDASNCDETDAPNPSVVETVKLYYEAGYKIIFCSGRMEKDRSPTVRFIEKCLPTLEYKLLMRADKDTRQDAIIKKEILERDIKNNYNVKLVLDDRASVCRMWFENGLSLFRVGDPDANF